MSSLQKAPGCLLSTLEKVAALGIRSSFISKVRAQAARWAYHKSLQQRRNVQSTEISSIKADVKDNVITPASGRSGHSHPLPQSTAGEAAKRRKRRLNLPAQFHDPYEYWQFNQDVLGRSGKLSTVLSGTPRQQQASCQSSTSLSCGRAGRQMLFLIAPTVRSPQTSPLRALCSGA